MSEEEEKENRSAPRKAPRKQPQPVGGISIESDSDDDEAGVLYLNNSGISSIPKPAPGSTITKLILSRNKIREGLALQHYSQLVELNLDLNKLNSRFFWNLKKSNVKIPTLRVFYINKNSISNLNLLLEAMVEVTPKLDILSMLFNPCNDNDKKYDRYKTKVLFKLTTLTILDSEVIIDDERAKALEMGPAFFTSKPIDVDLEHSDSDSEETVILQHNVKSAAYIGKGKIKYDGRESEGNRFITNTDL